MPALKLVQRPGSAFWYLRGSVGGRRLFETTGEIERGKAEVIRQKREAELFEARISGGRARDRVSFERAALSYIEDGADARSEATLFYIERLEGYFAGWQIEKIDQAAVDEAVRRIVGADAAPATKNRGVIGPLSAILNHAARRGWCDAPKFERKTEPRPVTRFLLPEQALALESSAAPHLRPLIRFAFCTGARAGEMMDLQWETVDLAAARATFVDTKNGTDRAASLPPAAVAVLAALRHRNGSVFRRDDGEPYVDRERQEGGQFKRAFATACRKAKIEEFTPHDMRHTWATWFYGLSKDLLLLKAEGGWRTLSMVERYAHLMPTDALPTIANVWGASHPRLGLLPVATGANPVQSPPLKVVSN